MIQNNYMNVENDQQQEAGYKSFKRDKKGKDIIRNMVSDYAIKSMVSIKRLLNQFDNDNKIILNNLSDKVLKSGKIEDKSLITLRRKALSNNDFITKNDEENLILLKLNDYGDDKILKDIENNNSKEYKLINDNKYVENTTESKNYIKKIN